MRMRNTILAIFAVFIVACGSGSPRETLACAGVSAGHPVCWEVDVAGQPTGSPYRDCRTLVSGEPVAACDVTGAAGECAVPATGTEGPPGYTVTAGGVDAATAAADCADLGGEWMAY